MTLLDTRNRFYADTEILAEPLDANFASIWGVVNGGITGDNIVAKSIGNGNLADNCIDTAKLAQYNVVHNQHIVNNTISGVEKIQSRSIDGDRLMLGSVGADIIANGSIDGRAKLQPRSVQSSQISNIIGGVKLATPQGTQPKDTWVRLGNNQFQLSLTAPAGIPLYAKVDAVLSVQAGTVGQTNSYLDARIMTYDNERGYIQWCVLPAMLMQGKYAQLSLTSFVSFAAGQSAVMYIDVMGHNEEVTISDQSYMSWVLTA